MVSHPQRIKKPIIGFDDSEILMRYKIKNNQRMNKQQQQSHKIRNTKSNIKSNPSRNKTTTQATNKL
jgi:hypothetical protein